MKMTWMFLVSPFFILFYFFSMLFILPQNTNGKNTRLSHLENDCGEKTQKETLSLINIGLRQNV